MDETKLKYLIRKQIVSELLKLEERKMVRTEQEKINEKKRRDRDDELDRLEAGEGDQTMDSPMFRPG